MKVCTKCGKEKPLTEFFPRYDYRKAQGKLSSWCKKCHGASGVQYKRRSPAARQRYTVARRRHLLRTKYGLTADDLVRMLEAQGGQCAICHRSASAESYGKPKQFAVDHDHKTGRVRGLLCDWCNRGIGFLGEDPDRLIAAAEYLRAAESGEDCGPITTWEM